MPAKLKRGDLIKLSTNPLKLIKDEKLQTKFMLHLITPSAVPPYIEELLQQSVPGKRVTLDNSNFSSRVEADPFGVDESSSEDEDEEISSANNDTTAVEATDELQQQSSSSAPNPRIHACSRTRRTKPFKGSLWRCWSS